MFPINMNRHNTFSVKPGNFLFVKYTLLFWKALPEFNQTGVLRRFCFCFFVRLHTLYCEFCKLGSYIWKPRLEKAVVRSLQLIISIVLLED